MAVATGHISERTCRVCRQKAPQSQLQRWTVQDGQPIADAARRAEGRGWYVCDSTACRAQIERVVSGQAQSRKQRSAAHDTKKGSR